MQRRSFLAATISSLVPGRAPAWTIKSEAVAVDPEGAINPSDLVIVYNSRDPAEIAAAQELQSFLKRMTMIQPRTVADDSPGDTDNATRFLVGRTVVTERLVSSGQLEDPVKKDREAYVVRSVDANGKRHLCFLGGTGISTLYAVYHYLKKGCGCGFYWDGDRVPSRNTLPVQGVNISAQPRFSERMCMNLTLYWYSTPWWDWDDWKGYIDWALKARFNILSLWDTPGEDVAWREGVDAHGRGSLRRLLVRSAVRNLRTHQIRRPASPLRSLATGAERAEQADYSIRPRAWHAVPGSRRPGNLSPRVCINPSGGSNV